MGTSVECEVLEEYPSDLGCYFLLLGSQGIDMNLWNVIEFGFVMGTGDLSS